MAKFKNPLVTERKPPKEPIYNIPKSQLDGMLLRERKNGFRAGVTAGNVMYAVSMLFELRDTLGWGRLRLLRILGRVQKLFESIADKSVNYAELAEVIRDECNINLIIERPDGSSVTAMQMFNAMVEADRKAYTVKIR